MSKNLRFEAYLESLGIVKGASITYRRDMIAAMYHAIRIHLNGWSDPIFPLAKLKGGWIGWLGGELDMQASEGWPFSTVTTRHVVRKWTRKRKQADGSFYDRHFSKDVIEVMMPERFDYIESTLRFLRRYHGEDRAAIVAGFCEAIGRSSPQYVRRLTDQLDLADRLFTSRVKSAGAQKDVRWRKLAKELGL